MPHCNTILSQILKFVPRHEFEVLAKQHHSGRAFRTSSRWAQFVGLMMAQLSGRNSLRDIVDNLSAQAHRIYHLGSSKLTKENLTPFTRQYLDDYYNVAKVWHLSMTFALKTHSIHWMPARLICVYRCFPGQISEQPKARSNYM